ncbi:MAG: hypothetical protein AAFQ12_14545 [Pseudomonadota bacterium]
MISGFEGRQNPFAGGVNRSLLIVVKSFAAFELLAHTLERIYLAVSIPAYTGKLF